MYLLGYYSKIASFHHAVNTKGFNKTADVGLIKPRHF